MVRRCIHLGIYLAGASAVAALVGCGSDTDGGSRLSPPAGEGAAEDPDDIVTEAGQLNPADPLAPNGGENQGTNGIIGLVDGEPTEDQSCTAEYAALAEVPPVIQFVVDTSGSMNWVAGTERLPAAGERSKWEITQEALAAAIAGMPNSAAVGLSYYPNTPGGGPVCISSVVAAPIEPLTPEQRALIEQVNLGQTASGGTPTHAAYEFGVEQLEGSTLEGSRFLVLITDGIPTFTLECGGDGQTRVDGAPLIASVEERFQGENIRTFVIGSPGSEPARDELSDMALVGGTGVAGCEAVPGSCHFDMTGQSDFSAALQGALGDIADATLGCEYAVPEVTGRSTINFNDVSVVLESAGNTVREFQPAATTECDAGWQYNGDRTSIALCRSTCDELNQLLRGDPGIAVRVKFGCRAVPT